jgi:hypothetical protein
MSIVGQTHVLAIFDTNASIFVAFDFPNTASDPLPHHYQTLYVATQV